jgi:cell division protein DivIC
MTKVHQLNNQYTKIKYSKYQAVLHSRKQRSLILVTVFLVIITVLTLKIISTKNQSDKIANQQQRVENNLQISKDDNKKLSQNIKQLHNNDYIQKVIRQKYYYTKPGETVYSLPGDVSRDVTQN